MSRTVAKRARGGSTKFGSTLKVTCFQIRLPFDRHMILAIRKQNLAAQHA